MKYIFSFDLNFNYFVLFRYSLNGGIKTVPVPYLPADTTRYRNLSYFGSEGIRQLTNDDTQNYPFY